MMIRFFVCIVSFSILLNSCFSPPQIEEQLIGTYTAKPGEPLGAGYEFISNFTESYGGLSGQFIKLGADILLAESTIQFTFNTDNSGVIFLKREGLLSQLAGAAGVEELPFQYSIKNDTILQICHEQDHLKCQNWGKINLNNGYIDYISVQLVADESLKRVLYMDLYKDQID